jgi:hypothetical protein
MTQSSSNLYRCTNVAFAAYLELNGYPIQHLEIERPGKGIFCFSIEEKDLNAVRCKWSNSPEAEFNARLNRMKSMTY